MKRHGIIKNGKKVVERKNEEEHHVIDLRILVEICIDNDDRHLLKSIKKISILILNINVKINLSAIPSISTFPLEFPSMVYFR